MTKLIPNAVAIYDLGSARTKLLIAAKEEGAIRFFRYKEETAMGGEKNAEGALSKEVQELLLTAISKLAMKAGEKKCDITIAVATDALRSAQNGALIIEAASKAIGAINVLSPAQEGLLFYKALKLTVPVEGKICAMDVGGGSVQVIWGESEKDIASMPTGTFRLQSEYHGNRTPILRDYVAMEEHLRNRVRSTLPSGLCADTLVLGSNCMAEFVMSAMTTLALPTTSTLKKDKGLFALSEFTALYETIKGQPYAELAKYYPSNPKYMYGADKALINAIAVASFIQAKMIYPTDESVSTAIARLAFEDPEALKLNGLAIVGA